MKSGSGSPFDDETEFDQDEQSDATDDYGADQTETLPYKYRRDGVQDDRQHANLFLRQKAQDHIDDVVNAMEDAFENESVYKIDVLEAVVLAANDPNRTVENELRKMGYGMK